MLETKQLTEEYLESFVCLFTANFRFSKDVSVVYSVNELAAF